MSNKLQEANKKVSLKGSKSSNYKIPDKAAEWKEKDLEFFNIKLDKLEVPSYSKEEIPDVYKKIFLVGWGKEKILSEDLTQLNDNDRSIVQSLRSILNISELELERGTKLSYFINLLLNKLGFNDSPYSLFYHYKYSIHIKNQIFNSMLDFLIFKDNKVFIIQNNYNLSSNIFNDWRENHIIGEILISALHIANIKQSINPITINFINIVGTHFTFYKSELSLKYIADIYYQKPEQDLIIRRYPQKDKLSGASTLDFCIEKDRYNILNAIYLMFN